MKFVLIKKRKALIILIISLVIILAIISSAVLGVKSVFSKSNKKLPIYSVKKQEKELSISFDCAWGVDYTDKLLNIMQEENVKCTFFMVEFWTRKYPEYVKKISEQGHEIGTHSSTHPYMSKLSKENVIKELLTSKGAIEQITNKKVSVFRPPYGDYNNQLIECAESLGLYTIQWSVDSLDWKNLSRAEIENRVLKNVKNGSIVLFHNQGLHTHEAIKNIIKTLKAQGYIFKPIGELIYKENYIIDSNGTQILNN